MSLLLFARVSSAPGPTLIRDIPLPGDTTRFDYQSIDPQRNWLFIAHLGDGAVVVVDIARHRIAGTVPHVARAHGVLVVPELGEVFASATGTNDVAVIDERTLTIRARVPGGVYPDGMTYDPQTERVFVSDEHGRTVTVIDTQNNRRIATIQIGGDVGNSQYDRVSAHVFTVDQTDNELVEIDPSHLVLVRRYPLTGCQGSHGLMINDTQRQAYIACEDNARLVNFDLVTKRQLQILTVGESPDVLAFDAGRRILFVACENGHLTTFTDTGGRLHALEDTYIAPSAHTITIDQRSHLLYLPLESINGKPVLRIMRFK